MYKFDYLCNYDNMAGEVQPSPWFWSYFNKKHEVAHAMGQEKHALARAIGIAGQKVVKALTVR